MPPRRLTSVACRPPGRHRAARGASGSERLLSLPKRADIINCARRMPPRRLTSVACRPQGGHRAARGASGSERPQSLPNRADVSAYARPMPPRPACRPRGRHRAARGASGSERPLTLPNRADIINCACPMPPRPLTSVACRPQGRLVARHGQRDRSLRTNGRRSGGPAIRRRRHPACDGSAAARPCRAWPLADHHGGAAQSGWTAGAWSGLSRPWFLHDDRARP